MKMIKSNSTSTKYNTKLENYKNKIYNSSAKEIILTNNNFQINPTKVNIIDNNPKVSIRKQEYTSTNDNYIKNLSPYLTSENYYPKSFFHNSFSTKNKIIQIKNPNLKRQILGSENYNKKNNTIIFNKTCYPINKYKYNYYHMEEEPFSFNDKYITNSFIVNQDDKIKIYKNNGYSQSSSKLLGKDLPSSPNITDRFQNSIIEKDQNYNVFDNSKSHKYLTPDYSEEYITFRSKEYILNRGANITIDAQKPRKLFSFNNRNKNKNFKNNLSYNDYDISLNTYRKINSRIPKRVYKSKSNLNSLNESENIYLSSNNEYLSNENSPKVNINLQKIQRKTILKKYLNNNKNNIQINEYKYKNNS